MGGAPLVVLSYDPMRTCIVWSVGGAGTVGITTHLGVPATSGLQLTAGNLALFEMDIQDFGPIVNQAWFANGPIGAFLTMFVLTVREWPNDNRPEVSRKEAVNNRPADYIRWSNLISNRWSEPKTIRYYP
jgi:hypothetical protein